ncbi:glycosyltransferase involved in cell wall biosynthesis [Cytobacillus eiseniae]|uniref:Glycosyltransferase involved in cell wall biosynthesis n=1 Tax=Cytobacillus eiseniae TaxID=762947 RepID=A0ABS4RG34_9BACI|nr:glycosyltransferase [Cytobacillus eiseniae]MBP2241865.1 glycosyltransferase involved in cell wall biosynthesis [Cytobacillus eiseniae]
MSLLVSINCITYNHEKYIAACMDGFLKQKTSFDFEIIIGEDCSTDQTRKMIEEYMKQFPGKIKLITSDSNVGWRENEKRVFHASKGKYIAICEGDDYWTDPYKLQKQVDYMESHPECSLCFHAAIIVNENGKRSGEVSRPYTHSKISPTVDMITGGGGFCPTASLLFKKESMENLPGFYQDAPVGDYPLQMILASQGYAYYMDEEMSAYRVGVSGSWTNQLFSGENAAEKIANVKKGEILLLEQFDQYTNKKYTFEIKRTIRMREFERLVLQNKRKQALDNEVFSEELSMVEKAKVYIQLYFPAFYPKVFMFIRKYQRIAKLYYRLRSSR